ncbi:MAG: Gfo/Idh/MocA family oxidoreductase [Rhodospirillaceae bacterium]|nr:Gfo/Idh/MocA family oxidoreductase [Rhodospirillaceae bacterium]
MPKSSVRVVVFGAGFGAYCLTPAFQRDSRATVVALCAPTATRRDAAAQKYGIPTTCASLDEVLERIDFDVAAIAVPPQEQEAIAMACLERRIPVFAEKPLGSNLASASRLAAMARDMGVPTAMDFIFPELAAWKEARRLLLSGVIGALRHVVVNWVSESFDNQRRVVSWKTDARLGGGVMSHFGSHTLHYLEWFCGPIASIRGGLAQCPGYHSFADTLATLSVDFQSKVSCAVVLCSAAPFGTGHRIDFYGENGVLSLVNDAGGYLTFRLRVQCYDAAKSEDITVPSVDLGADVGTDPRISPVSQMVHRFIDSIQTGRDMCPSFKDALRVQLHLDHIAGLASSVPPPESVV